jgi:hypothetical protein
MGAKTWMLVYADTATDIRQTLRAQPALDRKATTAFVAGLHHGRKLTEIADGSLLESVNPDDGFVYAGCFPGLTVLCTGEVGIDHPSQIDRRFLKAAGGRTVYLHAMHSVVDWFAYAIWNDKGELVRALSLSPDSGVMENHGKPLPFEAPYWAGERPLETDSDDEPYPLPFHPLELAEDALRALFGFNYEGMTANDDPDLERITLAGFKVS